MSMHPCSQCGPTVWLDAGTQPILLPTTLEVLKEAAAEAAQPAPAGAEDTAGLRARIRELEIEQGLMQAELDSVSELAQRMDSQLRYGPDLRGPSSRRKHCTGLP